MRFSFYGPIVSCNEPLDFLFIVFEALCFRKALRKYARLVVKNRVSIKQLELRVGDFYRAVGNYHA